jgi:phosphoribosylformylglycinamidine synthase
VLLDRSRHDLRAIWSETTHRMQALATIPPAPTGRPRGSTRDPAWSVPVTAGAAAPARVRGSRSCEQGRRTSRWPTASSAAGFGRSTCDRAARRLDLAGFRGLVAVGGFSYGDVLGAGQGRAKSVLYGTTARAALAGFFARPDTFGLGVCNGCQMMAALHELIPGAARWPRFVRNRSEQFEARRALVEVRPSPSIFFRDLVGARLPIVVSHGEGRAAERAPGDLAALAAADQVVLGFVDGHGRPATRYPHNPNGSPDGVTGVTTPDGRVTILMPHPERSPRSAWRDMSASARAWVG